MFQGMEYVYEVYKTRSFSRAAQNLYISQPSLSATIKKIENRIGTPLFDRSTTPIQLTECGKEYIRSMEKIMDIESGFENYLNDFNELKTGHIAIGGSNLYTSFVLPPLLTRFTQRFPAVNIRLEEADSAQLKKRLFAGSLDLVIDNSQLDPNVYQCHRYQSEHLLLAVPPCFASNTAAKSYLLTREDILSSRFLKDSVPCVPLSLFSREPFLFLRSGNDTRQRAERICQLWNFQPRVVLKLDQQITAFNLSCFGMGCSFVSDTLIRTLPRNVEMCYYKLPLQEARREIYFYHKKNRYITRAMEEFLKLTL